MALSAINYSPSVAIPCTLASLPNSATVGRQCTVVDNTANKYDDVMLTLSIKTGAVSGTAGIQVYIFGSEDGTTYECDDAPIGASDAAYTVNSASNLRGPVVISAPTSAKIYTKVITIATFFGGVMPRKWGFVVVNNTGGALDATEGNHAKSYTGLNEVMA